MRKQFQRTGTVRSLYNHYAMGAIPPSFMLLKVIVFNVHLPKNLHLLKCQNFMQIYSVKRLLHLLQILIIMAQLHLTLNKLQYILILLDQKCVPNNQWFSITKFALIKIAITKFATAKSTISDVYCNNSILNKTIKIYKKT